MAAEAEEVAELNEMFNTSPTRESTLPIGAYSKFTVLRENKQNGKRIREEMDARKAARSADVEERTAKLAERAEAERLAQNRIRKVIDQRVEEKQHAGRMQRGMMAESEKLRHQKMKQYEAAARKGVGDGRALHIMQRDATKVGHEIERQEAKDAKLARKQMADELRKQRDAANQSSAEVVRTFEKISLEKKTKKWDQDREAAEVCERPCTLCFGVQVQIPWCLLAISCGLVAGETLRRGGAVT